MQITTILNCYRRPYYLKEQVEAIRNQSIKTDKLWLWVNYHEDNKDWDFSKYGFDTIVRSTENFKYHGRFTLGLLAKTDYVAFFDDDTIPGKDWFKNCLNHSNEPRILGGAGVKLLSREYMHHQRVGWPSLNNELEEVDLVGHAWFMPKEFLHLMWLKTPTLDNGEDIQLSFNLKTYFGVKTYCPPHPKDNPELWSSLKPYKLGDDNKASSNGSIIPYPEFCGIRNAIVEYCINNGWKTVNGVK